MREVSVRVKQEIDVVTARAAVRDLCKMWKPQAVAEAELIVTELASNLWRHAGGGRMVLRLAEGLEIFSEDQGPGIDSLQLALEGQGHGLRTVYRLAQSLQIDTDRGKGTQITVAKGFPAFPPLSAVAGFRKHLGCFNCQGFRGAAGLFSKKGEVCGGDGYLVLQRPDGFWVTVVDALGHGKAAAEVAYTLLLLVNRLLEGHHTPEAVMEACHRELQGSRGAAMALVRGDKYSWEWIGLGNIRGKLLGPASANFSSMDGIVGYGSLHLRRSVLPRQPNSRLCIYTDGVRWPGPDLMFKDLSFTAVLGEVLTKGIRGNDDACFLIIEDSGLH